MSFLNINSFYLQASFLYFIRRSEKQTLLIPPAFPVSSPTSLNSVSALSTR
jgi:hypothetical protein